MNEEADVKYNSFSRKEAIIEYYKTAKELHLHQDNIRFAMLKFYFLSVFGLLVAFGKLQLGSLNEGFIFILVFGLGVVTLLVLMNEHAYFLRYKKWVRILESEIASPSTLHLYDLTYSNNQELTQLKRGFDLSFTLIVIMVVSANSAVLYLGLSKLGINEACFVGVFIIWVVCSSAYYVSWALKS